MDATTWAPSYEQESVAFWKLTRPGQPFNVVAVAVAPAEPDLVRLRSAAAELAAVQPMLRCRLEYVDDSFRQSTDGPPPDVELLGQLPSGSTLRHQLELMRSRPFDDTGPMARVGVLLSESGRTFLLASLDHWIADARSVELFLQQLIDVYEGRDPELGRGDYRSYADWQRTTAEKEGWSDQEIAYWTEVMAGATPLDLPRAVGESRGRAAMDIRLGGTEAANAVRELATELRTTPHAILTAATATALGRRAGTDDVPLVTVYAARAKAHARNLIGCFATLRPIRCRLDGQSFTELCAETAASSRRALKFSRTSDISLAMAVPEMIECYLDESHERVVIQVHVERERAHASPPSEPSILSRAMRGGEEHGVELEFRLAPDQLILQAEYGASRYDEDLFQALGRDVVRSIQEAGNARDRPVGAAGTEARA